MVFIFRIQLKNQVKIMTTVYFTNEVNFFYAKKMVLQKFV